MAKKIRYSTPLKYFWDYLYGTQKKLTPEIPDEYIFHILRRNLLYGPLADGETQELRTLLLSGLDLWKEDLKGRFLHIFFLDKQLRDFLEKTPLSDLDGIREYLYTHGKQQVVQYTKTLGQSKCVRYTFGLHIPHEKEGYAFSLSLYENNSLELYFSHGINGGLLTNMFYKNLNRQKDEKSIALSQMFRLAINTLAYMKCFPECVSEGVPKITSEKDELRSEKNVTFKLSQKITDPEITERSKIPHFRKGHFKLLQSDYFTHKKGQLIFVTETMVKGKAKTVYTSTQIEEFSSKSGRET